MSDSPAASDDKIAPDGAADGGPDATVIESRPPQPKEGVVAGGEEVLICGKPFSRRTLLGASLVGFACRPVRAEPIVMKHVVLLGDSVFDNAR